MFSYQKTVRCFFCHGGRSKRFKTFSGILKRGIEKQKMQSVYYGWYCNYWNHRPCYPADRKTPTRIVVERVYLGGQSMEDAFRKINEETVKENIEEIMGKTV